jgi:pyruvate carboxylase
MNTQNLPTENHKRFKKLMVANRGEIAIRVLRAAAELNLATVSVFTYEDRYALHRYKSDEAYQIGPDDSPLKPYLDIEEILRVAKLNGVDAIHPGYGFLSENVQFARRCREEGITFIGPEADVMARLGDKVAAKNVAAEADVPQIPDARIGDGDSENDILEKAKIVGYPLMVKAVAGGGGRGMRVVRTEESLLSAFREAQGEAKTAFGDGTVFLEKFIENPKHIEVQILGDQHRNLVHLFERDCSVQRRFQKVVEIAPSLTLSTEAKEKLYEYALRIGRFVNYSCAGTVEFLVDAQENIYFIEVNPRIQVEHTITEEITGIDLVRSQILICMGYPLHHPTLRIEKQSDIECQGFAIQCRITTENPSENFQPDFGTITAYRSPGGFGIRLDEGSAYTGAVISPFFDSMLVKVTAWGRTFNGAADRLLRALVEFRVRGVRTNIGFLENMLRHEVFRQGACTVNFITENPQLLFMPRRQDRGTKVLNFLAHTIVNGNPDVPYIDKKKNKLFRKPFIPAIDLDAVRFEAGTRTRLQEIGANQFAQWLKAEKKIHYTDTTMRDAHQSLFATRMRTFDMRNIAESYAHHHGGQLFSIEMWGGATFDVALRFLKECPWRRLEILRPLMPNVLFQMLLRGSNGVGYKAYPDNLIEKFIETSWQRGIDVFRIFDSFNSIDSMRTSIRAVVNATDGRGLAEGCIAYTGDIHDKSRSKFNIQYYLDMARRLEDEGVHLLGIKDMAGLLKPFAAEELINRLKETVALPLHLHTHDTSSIQAATYLKAIESGVSVVDVALASMSGLTSQPSFNALVAMMKGHERENTIDLEKLNQFSNYFEDIREYYYPFEADLKAGTAQVYDHEIPGGQYSNLRPQARSLGLESKFETIKENYRLVNFLFGDIVKVTPSSKVVGDMALFMTANNLSVEDVLERGENLSFPESVKDMMRGDLGLNPGGFPENIQKIVLKGESPNLENPNSYLKPVDFEVEYAAFKEKFGDFVHERDFLSYKLYPKVFEEFNAHFETYGAVRNLPTAAFFYGLEVNEEILVEIDRGKSILVQFLNMTEANLEGERTVFFKLNGQTRTLLVRDKSIKTEIIAHKKCATPFDIGAPLQGSLSHLFVKVGDIVAPQTPLFIIEAMKMESTIGSPRHGRVKAIHLKEKTLVKQDDLIVELESD